MGFPPAKPGWGLGRVPSASPAGCVCVCAGPKRLGCWDGWCRARETRPIVLPFWDAGSYPHSNRKNKGAGRAGRAGLRLFPVYIALRHQMVLSELRNLVLSPRDK
jgi:hypothetical protein